MQVRERLAQLRSTWPERTVQAVLAVVLWWAVYMRVAEGYAFGLGSGIIAATCTAWGYVILSSYVTHLLNARGTGGRPHGPNPPGGRWPGVRP
jgi:hypothetical protein